MVNPNIIDSAAHVETGTEIRLTFLYENNDLPGVIKTVPASNAECSIINQPLIGCMPVTPVNFLRRGMHIVNTGALFNSMCMKMYKCSSGENCNTGTCTVFYSDPVVSISGIAVRARNPYAPAQVTGFTATPGNVIIDVSWNGVNDPSGGEVFAYGFNLYAGATLLMSAWKPSGSRSARFEATHGIVNETEYKIEIWALSYSEIGSPVATVFATPNAACITPACTINMSQGV